MFDCLTAVGLLDAMRAGQHAERLAVARRLLAAGRLCQLRMAEAGEVDRSQWCIDNWEAVAAEVGAELGISRGRASSQMNYGVELLERLPHVAEVFAAGAVDFRVIAAVVFRTGLITDTRVLAAVDARLAAQVSYWNTLSRRRVSELVDWLVSEADPAAVRSARSAERDRHIEFGDAHDGMVEFWGALRATDAAIVDRRLEELVTKTDQADTRSKAERRADALVALAAGEQAADAGRVTIHLVAEATTVTGRGDSPGYLPGYGAISAETVRALAARATVRPLARPAELTAEPRYRPSAALTDFIRSRDICCRFPGCDKPADVCDIDHTIPWELGGPTHPSNLALLCRAHHLIKTFWTGENGWQEKQFSDGTIRWTSPSGRTYTTRPGGALFFPQLAEPTETLNIPVRRSFNGEVRTLMMPSRRRSRAAERAARINWERGLNQARMAADPPPF
jgi:hypothetical protein